MDNALFDIEEYTDPGVCRIMQGNTCRHCANRQTIRQGQSRLSVCTAHKSGRTKSGCLRVRVDQPACILFTNKNNAKYGQRDKTTNHKPVV